MEDFRALGRRLSNWGRWARTTSTTNLLTPDRVAAAARLTPKPPKLRQLPVVETGS